MKFSLIALIALMPLLGFPQSTPSVSDSVPEAIYQVVERMPDFVGGIDTMNKYLAANIARYYPSYNISNAMEGAVLVRFVVNKKGEIINAKLVKPVESHFDTAAIRMVTEMPNWQPGMQAGKKVSVLYTIQIIFNLASVNAGYASEMMETAALTKEGKLEEAVVRLTKLIEQYPLAYSHNVQRGKIWIKLKENTRACEDFKKAKEMGDYGMTQMVNKYCK